MVPGQANELLAEAKKAYGPISLATWELATPLARELEQWRRGPETKGPEIKPKTPVTAWAQEFGLQLGFCGDTLPMPWHSPGRIGAPAAPGAGGATEDAAWLRRVCAAHASILPIRDIVQGTLEALALSDEGTQCAFTRAVPCALLS